ncbi:MAG: chalcone isomerase family protein [Proteobacteria bacterium]|nr:chalcone isomerase family protein [Pseudomonadota bacterium]MBU1740965.1 chalcone isomerase family protein [Pseudomonadota bacterium]
MLAANKGNAKGWPRNFATIRLALVLTAAVSLIPSPSPAAPAKPAKPAKKAAPVKPIKKARKIKPAKKYRHFPDKIRVAGKKLTLAGAGERKRFFNTVYVAGLYLERPTKNDHKAVASEQVKQIRIRAKNLTRRKLIDALNRGLHNNNTAATLKAVGPRIEKFIRLLKTTKPKPGDRLVLTYVPKKGTAVTFRAKKLGLIKGRDFMRALFAVWLGENPASASLKHKMLGQ